MQTRQQTTAPMQWNPFNPLWETDHYVWSRIRRSTLFMRFMDIFLIFYGGLLAKDMGILDYLFPFARIFQNSCHVLSDAAENPSSRVKGILKTLFVGSFLLTVIFSIPKFLISSILASISMIVAIPLHVIVQKMTQPLREKISRLTLHRIDYFVLEKHENQANHKENIVPKIQNNSHPLTEEAFMESKNNKTFEIPDALYKIIPLDDQGNEIRNNNYALNKPIQLGLCRAEQLLCNGDAAKLAKPYAAIPLIPENKEAIHALLKTNFFHTTKNLEKANLLSRVKNYVKSA